MTSTTEDTVPTTRQQVRQAEDVAAETAYNELVRSATDPTDRR